MSIEKIALDVSAGSLHGLGFYFLSRPIGSRTWWLISTLVFVSAGLGVSSLQQASR